MSSLKKILIILSIFLLIEICISRKRTLNEKWNLYKKYYSKHYTNSTEEEIRKLIFKKNINIMKKHNKAYKRGKYTYKMGFNKFTDMTAEEFKYFVMEPNLENYGEYKRYNENINMSKIDNLPNSFGWIRKGWDTDVPDQGQCCSCYAFGAVGAIEAHYFIKYGKHIKLSQQDVIDCPRKPEFKINGCKGGKKIEVFNYAIKKGISLLSKYPYTAVEGKCRKTRKRIKIKKYATVKPTEEALKWTIVHRGPTSVSIKILPSFFMHKKGVYYDEKCTSDGHDHAVVVVGYGSEDGVDFWLVKNSWGPKWGLKGYIKMARNRNNHCGIASLIAYPIF